LIVVVVFILVVAVVVLPSFIYWSVARLKLLLLANELQQWKRTYKKKRKQQQHEEEQKVRRRTKKKKIRKKKRQKEMKCAPRTKQKPKRFEYNKNLVARSHWTCYQKKRKKNALNVLWMRELEINLARNQTKRNEMEWKEMIVAGSRKKNPAKEEEEGKWKSHKSGRRSSLAQLYSLSLFRFYPLSPSLSLSHIVRAYRC